MSVEEFLGGVRVLQPSAENLRDPPPLDVFDRFVPSFVIKYLALPMSNVIS